MIDLLLQAERVLTMGQLDQAERLYRQAIAADPQNSIAVVGLARVALERADDEGALREARRALAIDPENVAAARLATRLEEVLAYRARALAVTMAAPAPAEPGAPSPTEPEAPSPTEPEAPPPRGVVDRLLRRNHA